MSFGKLFRRERKRAGKSMGEVARHLGVSTVYISDVENEHRAPLTKERILRAAAFFGVDPEPFLAAAAKSRGSFELDAEGVSAKAREVGAALMRGWPDLEDEELDEIAEILRRRKEKGE